MNKMRIPPGKSTAEIYMIMRVFELSKDTMGVKVYLDPDTLREDGALIFTPETYSVKATV